MPGAFKYRSAFHASRRPAFRQRRLVTQTGEHVEQGSLVVVREAHAVGRDDRHVVGRGERTERPVVRLLVAQEVALQLDVDVRAAEGADEAIEQAANAVVGGVERRPARKHDEPARVAVESLDRQRALTLRRAELHPRDETAKVAIALLRSDEHRQAPQPGRPRPRRTTAPRRRPSAPHRQLGSDNGAKAGTAGGKVKPGDARDVVAIEQRQRGIPKGRRTLDESFGQ